MLTDRQISEIDLVWGANMVDFARAIEAEVRKEMEAAVLAEREACAAICDEQAKRSEVSMLKSKGIKARDIYSAAGQTAMWNAAVIRARTQQAGE